MDKEDFYFIKVFLLAILKEGVPSSNMHRVNWKAGHSFRKRHWQKEDN
jgi:hypothetical protein